MNDRFLSRVLGTIRPFLFATVLLALGAVPARANTPAPDGCTGPASGTWLRIVAEDVRSASGNIAITLYPDVSSRFLAKGGSLYVTFIRATQGKTEGCVYVPKPGVYVVALYHDENDNHHFDRSTIGLPVEGYGFSNNPPTLLGLPSFRSVRLNLTRSGLTSHISMKYP